MALAKHFAVGGGDSQRSRWHLADPKVGGQHRARVRDISLGSAGGSSSSVLSNQPGDCSHDQHRAVVSTAPAVLQDSPRQ